jgi:hypothetical protein
MSQAPLLFLAKDAKNSQTWPVAVSRETVTGCAFALSIDAPLSIQSPSQIKRA